MSKFYFTPGPSALYYTTEQHVKKAFSEQIPSISHRSNKFKDIYAAATKNVSEVLQLPDDYRVVFTSSATEVWERILQNLVERESFHLVNGAFSQRFYKIAEQLGYSSMDHEVDEGKTVDVERVLIPESAELIAMIHNETSTGAMTHGTDIVKIREAFPNQLLSLDVTSSAPAVKVDYSMVDTAYLSVQKAFGLPAGLGIWIVGPRCREKCEKLMNSGHSIGSYHSLPEMLYRADQNQTSETPNVLGIYLLAKVAEDMLIKGMDKIQNEIKYKAAVLYQALNESAAFEPFVEQERDQSLTCIVAKSINPSEQIIKHFEKKGFIIGSGYGKHKSKHIRIANFPTHSKEHIEWIADELISIKI